MFPRAGGGATLLRGLRKRCPRCGRGKLFVTWFAPVERCPGCDLRFEKEEGGYLGAMVVNYMVGIGAWIAMLAVVLAFTVPQVPVVPLMGASAVLLIGLPLWFYPRSKMLWAAVEFLVLRADPDYREPMPRDPRAKGLE